MASLGGMTDQERMGTYLTTKLDRWSCVEGCTVESVRPRSIPDPDLADFTFTIRIPYVDGVKGRINDLFNGEVDRVFKSQDMGRTLVSMLPDMVPNARKDGAVTITVCVTNPALAIRLAQKNDKAIYDSASLGTGR